jgi:hypothetical protein
VAENAVALDQNSPPMQAFIRLLVDRMIVFDPTLGVFECSSSAGPPTADCAANISDIRR